MAAPALSYVYRAQVVRVVDGDTVWMRVDLGFRMSAVVDFRIAEINAPELAVPEGVAAKAELEHLLSLGSLLVETSKADKYGRWLARIYVELVDGGTLDVGSELVAGGHAKPYGS